MPQNAILFTGFRGPTGPVVAAANKQGAFVQASPGNTYWVNETTGSDTQANAGDPFSPFATLAAALAVAGNNDTIYITGTVHVSATVNITQTNLAIIGLDPPSANTRSRISQTGSTLFTPLVYVTGQGCRFENLGTFHGFATASTQICWEDAGGRNYYKNVDFMGMGNATAAAQAGSRSLLITGTTGENLFENCILGLDTIVRATATNATLEIAGGSPRNIFRNCLFQALCSLATDVHVLVGADGMDRYALFDNCVFTAGVDSTGTTLNAAFSVNTAAGGSVIMNGGVSIGATAIATTGPVYVNGAVPTATTSSIGIKAT